MDLNPDIYDPAEFFRRENLDVIDNPKLTITVNDGRNALLLSPEKYSVIISDATNPKMFDSWTLYTREFYQLTRSRLRPGGVFARWLVYPLPGDSLTSILRTFRSVYPHMSLWSIHGSSQCLMLGTPERLNIDYEEFSRRLGPVLELTEFDRYGVTSAPKFLSFLMLGEDELGEMLEQDGPISTDDLPYPQFQYGRSREGVQEGLDLLKHQNTIMPYLSNLGPDREAVQAELEAHRDISQRLNIGFFLSRWQEYRKAAYLAKRHGMPDDANVTSALRFDSERLRHHLGRLEEHPEDPELHNSLGYVYWKQGDLRRAESHLGKSLDLAPGSTHALANLAQVQIALGDLAGAAGSLLRLHEGAGGSDLAPFIEGGQRVIQLLSRLEAEAPTFEHHRQLTAAYFQMGDILEALEHAHLAESLIDGDVIAHRQMAELYADLGLVDEAAQAYRRAADLAHDDPDLAAAARFAAMLQQNPRQWQDWLHQRYSVVDDGQG